MIVMKFGGTSVGSASAMGQAADIVYAYNGAFTTPWNAIQRYKRVVKDRSKRGRILW